MNMDFGANKTPVEGIKKRTFWGTYFRDISSNGNDNPSTVNGTESHEKNLMSWEILIRSIIAQIFMMLVLINMVSNVGRQ